jgi:protein transport protein SEC23
LDYLRENQIA